ncbi:MAG TPA: hypothetical protein VGM25_17395 [Caulobacteraceae bacterium]|jgi:hypothetical protein
MTHLILMLAVAVAMALFREPLGQALVWVVRAVDWKWAAILVILTVGVWSLLRHVQGPAVAPIAGDGLTALLDVFAYTDVLVGATLALLDRQARQLTGRVAAVVRIVVGRGVRLVARGRRSPIGPRRRPPDRDEPEPAIFGGILLFS